MAVVTLLRDLPSRGRLLDVGAGHGTLATAASSLGFDVTAADLASPDRSRQNGSVGWVRANAAVSLPFRGDSFDVVTCVEVIEHVEDQFQLVREVVRVIRPGGLLLLSTPNVLNLASRVRFLLSGTYSLFERPVNELQKNPAEDHIHPISYYQLRYILMWSGFESLGVTTDRFRNSALWLSPMIPFVTLATWLALRKEKDSGQRGRNSEVLRHVLSPSILFGRTQVVVARKAPRPVVPAGPLSPRLS
ncbi:MAG: methyltransferase domain-containing protein [Candidatus Wallbacteria bacterium]|nr:methyltransferase domain-containing protein [Candidatus Wallbacteria bacterium]